MSFFFNGMPGMQGFPGGHPGAGAGGGGAGGGGDESDDGESSNTTAYYELMGIEKNATEAEIKKAYRKQARLLHPDRHQGADKEEFEKQFKDLQSAYEVLKDPSKRQLYDKYGEAGLKSGGGGSGMGDIFDMFFQGRGGGGGGGGGGARQQRQKKAPAIKSFLDITYEDCYIGSTKELTYSRYVLCSGCDGKGGKTVIECDACNGTGRQVIHQRMGYITMQTQRECPKCDAQGTIIPPKSKCKKCDGKGMKRMERKIDLPVPMGSKNADKIVLRGQGHEIPDAANGDVLVILRVAKHEVFERIGADLAMSYEISLKEALCGYDIKIKHFGKKVLHLRSKKGEIVQPGQLKRIVSQGMPQKGAHTRGHLYVKFEIKFPETGDLGVDDISSIKSLLPGDDSKDDTTDNDIKMNEKNNNNSNSNTNNNNNNNNNNNKKNKNKKGKKNKNKKGKKNKNKKNTNNNNSTNNNNNNKSNASSATPDTEDFDDDMEDHVTADDVDGEPKTTPASARSAYDEDEEGESPNCHQM